MAGRGYKGERKMFPLIFSSLLGLLVVACPLRGDQPGELAEGARALYRGEYDRAASLATSFVKAHPEASAGFILLARAEIAQGKYQPAYENLRQGLRLAPTSLDALYYLGRVTLILSQVQYRELYALAPDSARVHQLLAESYQAQENRAKAEEEYQAALKLNPRSVEVLDMLGDLERSQFHFDRALSYYSRAAEIEPRDYASAYGLGASYLYRQEPQRAIEYFRRALDLDPNSAAAHLALGDAWLRAQQPAAAVDELKAAAGLEPEMRQAYTLLAQAYEKLGQSRQAEEAIKKAKELTEREIESRQNTLSADPDPVGAALPAPSPEGAGNASPDR
jgi:protein O-GlcNAc transferase